MDDALGTWCPSFDAEALRATFASGARSVASNDGDKDPIFCCEEELKCTRAKDGATITLRQVEHLTNVSSAFRGLRPWRFDDPAPLRGHELTDLRSTIGFPQWFSGQSRPDLPAVVWWSQVRSTGPVQLRNACRSASYLRATACVSIKIVPLDISQIVVVPHGESSSAN